MSQVLELNQKLVIALLDIAMCVKGNMQVFDSLRPVNETFEMGKKVNLTAFNSAVAMMFTLKQLMPKNDYEALFVLEPMLAGFDATFLQEKTEVVDTPKSSIILLGP